MLREERAFTICRNVINSADPEGRHIVRPIELVRLPARHAKEVPIAVSIFEHPGIDRLSDYMYFGPAWSALILSTGEDGKLQAVRNEVCSYGRQVISLDAFLHFAIGAADCLDILHHGQRLVHGELRGDAFHIDTATNLVRMTVAAGSGLRTFEHGLSSSGWSSLCKEVGAMNKLTYMAPEQTGRFNAQEDSRTDIYSFGIILWTLLAKRPPFEGNSPMDILMGILGRRIPLVSSIRLDVPDAIAKVIEKMTAKTVHDRYQSVSGVKHDLIEIRKLLEAGDRSSLASFRIGMHDVSSFFVLPSIMLGRDKEFEKVVRIIEKVAREQGGRSQPHTSMSSEASISERHMALLDHELAAMGGSSTGSLRSTSDIRSNASALDDRSGGSVSDRAPQNPESKDQSVLSTSRSTPAGKHIINNNSMSVDSRSYLDIPPDRRLGGVLPSAGSIATQRKGPKLLRRDHCEIIAIAGDTGFGKTCLVQSIQGEARKRGYFASSRFDSRRTPLAAMLGLLSALFKQAFSESNTSSPFHLALKQYVRPVWSFLHR